MARKHIGWYLKTVPHAAGLREQLMRVESARAQRALVRGLFGDNNNELELAA